MRILVLGAGLQGSACAYDLLQQRAVDRVTVADLNPQAAVDLLGDHLGSRLVLATVDVQDATALRDVMREHDVVLCALPYYFNLAISRLALDLGIHCADLGGNTDIVFQQKQLNAEARAKGVTVIPDCGLAPGIANILAAEGIRRVADAETVKLFVGGLPQRPEPPLNYQLVYSLEGALDYYTTPAWVLRDGKPTHVDPLSEPEPVVFPPPLGTLEAFHTAGGISTLPWTYQGRIRSMEYKTLRYPGHVALMRAIRDLGLLALEPINVKGREVIPRDVFIAAVAPKLNKPAEPDLVALRVEVRGRSGAKIAWQVLDYFDAVRGISAMRRVTGYSLAITGIMQADGRIGVPGVHTPDEAVPFAEFVAELGKRKIEIREV